MTSKARQKIVTRGEVADVETLKRIAKTDVPKSLTLYVVFSFAVVIIYSIVELILSTKYQVSHDTLTTCVYGLFGGEVVCCALIKIFKLKSRDEISMGE